MSDPPDGKPPQLNYARRVRRPQGWWWWMIPLLVGVLALSVIFLGYMALLRF